MQPAAPSLFVCTIDDGYVLLRYGEAFPGNDLAVQNAVLEAVDGALVASSLQCVVFDTRPIVATVYGASRDRCWEWAMAAVNHHSVALVANSEMVQVQANMTARARKGRLRSFRDIATAVAWLKSPR